MSRQYMVRNADGIDLRSITIADDQDPILGLGAGETVEEIPLGCYVVFDENGPIVEPTIVEG